VMMASEHDSWSGENEGLLVDGGDGGCYAIGGHEMPSLWG
jgi:hypothetical protein